MQMLRFDIRKFLIFSWYFFLSNGQTSCFMTQWCSNHSYRLVLISGPPFPYICILLLTTGIQLRSSGIFTGLEDGVTRYKFVRGCGAQSAGPSLRPLWDPASPDPTSINIFSQERSTDNAFKSKRVLSIANTSVVWLCLYTLSRVLLPKSEQF